MADLCAWCKMAFWRKQCDGSEMCRWEETRVAIHEHTRLSTTVSSSNGWTSGSVGGSCSAGPRVRWPGGNRRFGVSSGYPKNSAKPPRARHASSEDTRAPGRRPAWRRARRGTNATCPSDATWQHMRLDMRRDEREASRGSGKRMHAGDANATQAQARKAQVSAHASVVSPLGG